MTNIENYLSIARRTGYEKMPINLVMCPTIEQKLKDYVERTGFEYDLPIVNIPDLVPRVASPETFLSKYYGNKKFKDGTTIDTYGVAHEPGSAAAFHMTKMYHPMEELCDVREILEYPLPDYTDADASAQAAAVERIHAEDHVAVGDMPMTIWEKSWYLRGMENLMADMMMQDPIAEAIFDRITDIAVYRAQAYARAGVDMLFVGDDIGMQHTIMMSEELYCEWIKHRLAHVIREAKKIKPDLLVFYHSCGYVKPMIPHLIEAGIDVLNPVQPECMDFGEIHAMYGDRLSFHGTIGTQSTMPFGTPDDVRREVYKNLEIAGDKGGLFVAPTHMLEPEVPIENVVAYIKACRDFK